MRVVPLTLKQANKLVAELHRHHKPCVGHRFSIGFGPLLDVHRRRGYVTIN